MIESLLPLLRGWGLRRFEDWDIRVDAGGSRILLEETRMGFLSEVTLTLDDPDARVVVEGASGSSIISLASTPRELYDTGSARWTPSGFYLDRYDDASKVYVVSLKPSPWIPFSMLRVRVEASMASPCTVKLFKSTLILVYDPEAFSESLRSLLTGARAPGAIAYTAYAPLTTISVWEEYWRER